MSINLLDIIKDQVSGSLASQASSFLGESEEATKSGLNAIFPSLLGSLISKSTEPDGASGIMDMIKGLDMDSLSNIGSLFGGGASNVNGLLNSGGGMLNSLLGDKMGGIVDIITKVSGMKSGSSSSLLKMAAPFLMSIIGKQVAGKGLSGLTDLLLGQKDSVAKSLPAGMGSLMGFANLGDGLKNIAGNATASAKETVSNVSNAASKTASKTTAAVADTASSGMGFIKWLLPLLLLGAGLYYFMSDGCKGTVADAVDATTELAGDAAGAATDVVSDAADAVVDVAEWTTDGLKGVFSKIDETAKAAMDKLTFVKGSAGSQMKDYINNGFSGDPLFTFRNLTFETGSNMLDASSNVEIDNVAAILKTYPGVKISIEGHTDNIGDAAQNKQLSQARAESVKGRLIAQGIDVSRLTTKGFGQTSPIASNDTEEGRAQNRRTDIRIVK